MGASVVQRNAAAQKKATEALQEALNERGWTQNELARQLETSSAVVSRWLTGQRRPELEMAVRLQRLLGISVESWIAS